MLLGRRLFTEYGTSKPVFLAFYLKLSHLQIKYQRKYAIVKYLQENLNEYLLLIIQVIMPGGQKVLVLITDVLRVILVF